MGRFVMTIRLSLAVITGLVLSGCQSIYDSDLYKGPSGTSQHQADLDMEICKAVAQAKAPKHRSISDMITFMLNDQQGPVNERTGKRTASFFKPGNIADNYKEIILRQVELNVKACMMDKGYTPR